MEITPFDLTITDNTLQMIKLIIPYLPSDMQRIIGVYVKMTEISYLMSVPHFMKKHSLQLDSILKDISPYLSKESQQQFSEFQQFFEMFEMMQTMDFSNMMDGMDFGDISSMFTPERNDCHE